MNRVVVGSSVVRRFDSSGRSIDATPLQQGYECIRCRGTRAAFVVGPSKCTSNHAIFDWCIIHPPPYIDRGCYSTAPRRDFTAFLANLRYCSRCLQRRLGFDEIKLKNGLVPYCTTLHPKKNQEMQLNTIYSISTWYNDYYSSVVLSTGGKSNLGAVMQHIMVTYSRICTCWCIFGVGEQNYNKQSSVPSDLYTTGEYMRGEHGQWASTHKTLMPWQLDGCNEGGILA